MPCAIVRPSIIGCLDGAPYPGYTGNLAGVSGGWLGHTQRADCYNKLPCWCAHDTLTWMCVMCHSRSYHSNHARLQAARVAAAWHCQ
jgi:hypothetical protein